MNLDHTRPEHREALKWACELTSENRTIMADRAKHGWALSEPTYSRESAALALSSPSDSAAIVRALLDGCMRGAVFVVEAWYHSPKAVRIWTSGAYAYVVMPDIPALVLRLLACTTPAEALAALREAGR